MVLTYEFAHGLSQS